MTTTKPADPAGEAFEAAARGAVLDYNDHQTYETMLSAIRTAANALAAERVKARKKLELEEQHDSLWTVHGIFFPTSDVCSFCVGDASSLKHDQLMNLIELRVAELAATEPKEPTS